MLDTLHVCITEFPDVVEGVWLIPGKHPKDISKLFSTAPKTTAGHGSKPLIPGIEPLSLVLDEPILPKITFGSPYLKLKSLI